MPHTDAMAYDEALADRIRELLEAEPGVTEKKMFGGLAFLVDGRMAVAAGSGGVMLLRVPPDDTEAQLQRPGAEPFVMRGREMTGWIGVRPDALGDDSELAEFVRTGVRYARTLTP